MKDCPHDHELGDDNDVPGMVLVSFPSAAASLGTHTSNALTHKDDPTSTCPDSNLQGCYSITYTVQQVSGGDQAQVAAESSCTASCQAASAGAATNPFTSAAGLNVKPGLALALGGLGTAVLVISLLLRRRSD
jgi:hypothetical protein